MTTVQISISGRGAHDDAPTVRDLLEQIADFLDMMDGVRTSIVGDSQPRYEWRVVGLSKASPATMLAEAQPVPGVPLDHALPAQVAYFTALGLQQLQSSEQRPRYFTDNVLIAADRFARRVNQGIARTSIVPDGEGQHEVLVAPDGAFATVQNIEAVRALDAVHPYQELGAIEGVIQSVGQDGYGKPFLILKHRVNGADVKCYLSGNARVALEREPIASVVWARRRVEAWGVLRFRNLGSLKTADVSELRFFPPSDTLPGPADIIDPHFTGGLPSDDYLVRLRRGDA